MLRGACKTKASHLHRYEGPLCLYTFTWYYHKQDCLEAETTEQVRQLEEGRGCMHSISRWDVLKLRHGWLKSMRHVDDLIGQSLR